jgi:hypothetical protein
MREQQCDAGQGRARFGRARMEVRRDGSGQTRMEGNETAHSSNLVRTAAEGSATRQGRGERESGSRKGCAGQRHARRQRIAVSPLDALRPRSNWCTGRSHVVREVLQRDDSGWTRPGGSRVARGEPRRPSRRRQWTKSGGTADCSWRVWRWPGASRPRSSWRWRGGYGAASRRKGGEAKAKVRTDWTSTSADASESVLPVADSARFRRRVRVQDNRPRASRLKASGVRAKQKRRTGDAIRRADPTGGYASVPAVSQWHLCVSRGSSTRETRTLRFVEELA